MKADNSSSSSQRARVAKLRVGPRLVILLILALSLMITSCAMLVPSAAY
jgi:hypothetical protein